METWFLKNTSMWHARFKPNFQAGFGVLHLVVSEPSCNNSAVDWVFKGWILENYFQPRGQFEVFLLKSLAHRVSGTESVSLLNTFVYLEIEILWIP